MTRIKELELEIPYHRLKYEAGEPEISNDVYNNMVLELTTLDPDSSVIKEVGSTLSKTSIWNKVKHSTTIGSLTDVFEVEGLLDWATKKDLTALLVMHKYDGLTIVCTYIRGRLVRALTRGDGTVGEDITKNILKVASARCSDPNFTGELRGELVIKNSVFDAQFASDHPNSRNLASGMCKRADGAGCEFLDIYFYDILNSENRELAGAGCRSTGLVRINSMFPNQTWFALEPITDLSTAIAAEKNRRDSLGYRIDGLVLRDNCTDDEHKKYPDYARAYKFESKKAITTVNDIIWNNTGKAIAPIAILEPVFLDGTTISKASLHNAAWVIKKNVGVGAQVLIGKAGDIIPQVDTIVTYGAPPNIPEVCPVCGSEVVTRKQFLVCSDLLCPAAESRRVKKLLSVLDINFAGPKVVELLTKEFGWLDLIQAINNDELIIKLEEKIAKLPRLGKKSAHRLCCEFKEKRILNTLQVFHLLDIDDFSSSRIQLLIDAGYTTVGSIRELTEPELITIKGIGKIIAKEIVEGLDWMSDILTAILDNFTVETVNDVPPVTQPELTMESKSFILTGKLSTPRRVWEAKLIAAGHTIDRTIKTTTDYLVCGDGPYGKKHKFADTNGIDKLTEEDLQFLLNQNE